MESCPRLEYPDLWGPAPSTASADSASPGRSVDRCVGHGSREPGPAPGRRAGGARVRRDLGAGGGGRDPFVHLALLLSATDRIICATGIASIWARDAVTTSCAAKTLTEAFPERVVVGLGASHGNLVRDLRGHDYDKPLTAMRAYLDGIERVPYTAHRPETPVRYVLAALRRRMLGWPANAPPGLIPTSSPLTTPSAPGTSSAPRRCSVPNRRWCWRRTATGRAPSPGLTRASTSPSRTT